MRKRRNRPYRIRTGQPGQPGRSCRIVAGTGVLFAFGVCFATPGAASSGSTASEAAAESYVALGDSYSSGVGTREYYPDSGDCRRSPHAYPVLNANAIGASIEFEACASARTDDVLNNQLAALDSSTDYVTISIGGNDAGFTDVLTKCAQPWPTDCWSEIDDANAYIKNTLPGRLDDVYTAIEDRAPTATVVVVGYPRLFNGEECNAGARISPGEQRELNATADLLAGTTGEVSGAHGYAFVDPRDAFTGHAICDDAEWINGLSNPISESYHPNRAGHRDGYAPLVKRALVASSIR